VDIFTENPLAHDFYLINKSTRNLGIDTKIFYPEQITTLRELRFKFCDFRRAYYRSSEVQEWFNNGWMEFSSINGLSPLRCTDPDSVNSGGGGSSDFSLLIYDEVPIGFKNGVNMDFLTVNLYRPLTLQIYKNGQKLTRDGDFTETGTNGFNLVRPPKNTDILTCAYIKV